MNTTALILAIITLGVSIVALIVTLKRKPSIVKEIIKETVIEPSQSTENTVNITCDEYPFRYVNGTFIIDSDLQVTGGVSCLNKDK